jgi:RpiR family transcriptional regulator, carbohydrate utilization regulator
MYESGAQRSPSDALERVRAARAGLRKPDAKVADLVLANLARVLESSLAETAELAGVSQPTVTRFCLAIGFSGYQELRLRLAHSLALGRSATHSVAFRAGDSEGERI